MEKGTVSALSSAAQWIRAELPVRCRGAREPRWSPRRHTAVPYMEMEKKGTVEYTVIHSGELIFPFLTWSVHIWCHLVIAGFMSEWRKNDITEKEI